MNMDQPLRQGEKQNEACGLVACVEPPLGVVTLAGDNNKNNININHGSSSSPSSGRIHHVDVVGGGGGGGDNNSNNLGLVAAVTTFGIVHKKKRMTRHRRSFTPLLPPPAAAAPASTSSHVPISPPLPNYNKASTTLIPSPRVSSPFHISFISILEIIFIMMPSIKTKISQS